MHRWLGLSLLGVCVGTALVAAGPLRPEKKTELPLPAFQQTMVSLPFRGGEQALVIASGSGSSPIALYVFDSHGNCLAKDDLIEPAASSSDDIAAEWYPPETSRYTIELRNVGYNRNKVQLATR
jgi:hypothetical protein